MKISDKVIFLTGATSGIGKATAIALAKLEAKLILVARGKDRLYALQQELLNQTEVIIAPADVSNKDQMLAAVQKGLDKFKKIDVLINNAGVAHLSMIESLKHEEWMRMLNVNLKGVLNTTYALLPEFINQKSGHIVNLSSMAGRRVGVGGAVYSMTKFGVNAFSEGLKQELTPKYNIRVTMIEPGVTRTDFLKNISDKQINKKYAGLLEEKVLEPEEIAEAIVYAIGQPEHVNVTEVRVEPSFR
jgi:NADP-dependent 3-hydroxy acid dehydrogenase YdfG